MSFYAEKIVTRLGHPFAVLMLIVAGYSAANWPLIGQATAIVTILYCLPLEKTFPRVAEWKLNLSDIGQATTWFVLLDRIIYPLTFAFCIIPLVEVLSHFQETLHIKKLWPTHWPLPIRACLALLIFQIIEYWIHRATHRWFILWRAHGVHHHLTKLTAFTGTISGIFDGIAITIGWVPLMAIGLDFTHEIMPLIVVTNGINILAHANIRFELPRWYRRIITTNVEHSIHHSVVMAEQNTNYSCYFTCVDLLFGTYAEGNVRDIRTAGAGRGKRLTFMQQLLFPFRKIKNFEAPLPWEQQRDEALSNTGK